MSKPCGCNTLMLQLVPPAWGQAGGKEGGHVSITRPEVEPEEDGPAQEEI